jgi:hypothetical protein
VEVVSLHFHGAARTWWNRLEFERARRGEDPIAEWHQLVYIMKRKYIPRDYKDNMRIEICRARQGTMTPEEFFAKLEDMFFKAGVSASPSTLRTRFIAGLNHKI